MLFIMLSPYAQSYAHLFLCSPPLIDMLFLCYRSRFPVAVLS